MLSVLNLKKEPFLLVCDKDKENEIADLKREGLLITNYHILEKGEFEDYIDSPSLISILKTFTPEIELTTDYIEQNRLRGLGTSKIIAKFYHQESIHSQNPPKPEVAKKIAQYWIENEVPLEFMGIMNKTLNLTAT